MTDDELDGLLALVRRLEGQIDGLLHIIASGRISREQKFDFDLDSDKLTSVGWLYDVVEDCWRIPGHEIGLNMLPMGSDVPHMIVPRESGESDERYQSRVDMLESLLGLVNTKV